jgi:hypothetical protein
MVLAELAAKIAPSEKNCTRAAPAAQRVFFTKVSAIAANPGMTTGATYTDLSSCPIDRAFPGTHIADGKMLVSLSNAPEEFAFLK